MLNSFLELFPVYFLVLDVYRCLFPHWAFTAMSCGSLNFQMQQLIEFKISFSICKDLVACSPYYMPVIITIDIDWS